MISDIDLNATVHDIKKEVTYSHDAMRPFLTIRHVTRSERISDCPNCSISHSNIRMLGVGVISAQLMPLQRVIIFSTNTIYSNKIPSA